LQAIIAAARISTLVENFKNIEFEPSATENGKKKYFYMNDWMGVYIAESEYLGTDDLILPQQELYFFCNESTQFIDSLNEAMHEARQ